MMQPNKDPLPANATHAQLAAFWDTHDITDYLDELQPISVKPMAPLEPGISVRFDRPTLVKLRAQAEKRGVGTTTLIRMWIKERLQTAIS
ncbi:MAG: BrnA antitoxin family protein [Anaerolineae bacterium]|nr:BrnA antitoxin family protein [Anaerolineae bacterium]